MVPHSSRGDHSLWGFPREKHGALGGELRRQVRQGVGSSWMCWQGRAYCKHLNVMQKEVILYVVDVREDHCWTDLWRFFTVTAELPGQRRRRDCALWQRGSCTGQSFSLLLLSAPCCPSDILPVLVSSDRVEIVWSPSEVLNFMKQKGCGWVQCGWV